MNQYFWPAEFQIEPVEWEKSQFWYFRNSRIESTLLTPARNIQNPDDSQISDSNHESIVASLIWKTETWNQSNGIERYYLDGDQVESHEKQKALLILRDPRTKVSRSCASLQSVDPCWYSEIESKTNLKAVNKILIMKIFWNFVLKRHCLLAWFRPEVTWEPTGSWK